MPATELSRRKRSAARKCQAEAPSIFRMKKQRKSEHSNTNSPYLKQYTSFSTVCSKFTTTSKVAKIIINENIDGISIGPIIPAGVLVCEGCGHIEFFALGTLGLLNNGKETSNGEQK